MNNRKHLDSNLIIETSNNDRYPLRNSNVIVAKVNKKKMPKKTKKIKKDQKPKNVKAKKATETKTTGKKAPTPKTNKKVTKPVKPAKPPQAKKTKQAKKGPRKAPINKSQRQESRSVLQSRSANRQLKKIKQMMSVQEQPKGRRLSAIKADQFINKITQANRRAPRVNANADKTPSKSNKKKDNNAMQVESQGEQQSSKPKQNKTASKSKPPKSIKVTKKHITTKTSKSSKKSKKKNQMKAEGSVSNVVDQYEQSPEPLFVYEQSAPASKVSSKSKGKGKGKGKKTPIKSKSPRTAGAQAIPRSSLIVQKTPRGKQVAAPQSKQVIIPKSKGLLIPRLSRFAQIARKSAPSTPRQNMPKIKQQQNIANIFVTNNLHQFLSRKVERERPSRMRSIVELQSIKRKQEQRLYLQNVQHLQSGEWRLKMFQSGGKTCTTRFDGRVVCSCLQFRTKKTPCRHIHYIITHIARNPSILSSFAQGTLTQSAMAELTDGLKSKLAARLAQKAQLSDNKNCLICGMEVKGDEEVLGQCKHCKTSFHGDCYEKWRKVSHVCAVCKANIRTVKEEQTDTIIKMEQLRI